MLSRKALNLEEESFGFLEQDTVRDLIKRSPGTAMSPSVPSAPTTSSLEWMTTSPSPTTTTAGTPVYLELPSLRIQKVMGRFIHRDIKIPGNIELNKKKLHNHVLGYQATTY